MLLFTNLSLKVALDFASALIALGVAAFASRYIHTKSGRYFMLTVLGVGEFAAAVGMEVLAPTLPEKIFWGKVQYLGLVVTAPGWFLFVVSYTQQAWMSRRVEASAWVVPAITLLAVWTNEYHHLYWPDVHLSPLGEAATYTHGFFFWVFVTYHYSLVVMGFLLVYWQAIKIPQLYRGVALAFTVSAFPTLLSNLLYLADPQRYPLSLMVTVPILISAPILLWAFFARRVFALRPVAYHLFFRQSTDATLMVNVDGFVVEANSRWLELTGQSLDDIIGKSVSDLFVPPLDVLLSQIERQDYEKSTKIELKTGEKGRCLIDTRILPIYNEEGEYIGLVITGRDVTEEERARQQIEVQLTALESVANGVVITDAKGHIEWANRAFMHITGYALEEVKGKNLNFLCAFDESCDAVLTGQDLVRSGALWTGEVTSRRKDGKLVAERRVITPLRDADGVIRYLVFTIQDITQDKQIALEMEHNLRHMQLLYDVSQVAASQTEPEVLARAIGERVRQALEVQAIYVAFYEEEKNLITIPYWNLDGETIIGPTLRYGEGITSYIIRTRQPLVIDEDFAIRAEMYNAVPVSSLTIPKTWVGVPIIVREKVIGVISIQDYRREHAFTSEQLDILITIASTLGVALANARLSIALQRKLEETERIQKELERVNKRLHIQAVRDPLTDLFNRRYLDAHLDDMLAYHAQRGRTVCAVMLDIDHFKRFNDTYGHDVGDVLLKSLGDILLRHTRKEDVPCRHGGDEFLIVLSSVDIMQAVEIVEKWRNLFAATACHAKCERIPTLSAGIAAYPLHAENGNTLLSKADQALYRAKQAGRDRVVVYKEGEDGDEQEVLPRSSRLAENS